MQHSESLRQPATVLVTEDDAAIRFTLETVLSGEGYRVMTAVDGLDALDVARRDPPSVILLDVAMPRLDARGFCREYRERGGAAPIILVTAAQGSLLREAIDSCAPAAYVTKPFSNDAVLDAVARYVGGPLA